MNDYNDDLSTLFKKKNEILKRIEENKKLMELIRNPHIKDTLKPLQMMKKNIAVKKIQNYWRGKKNKKVSDFILKKMNSNSKNNLGNIKTKNNLFSSSLVSDIQQNQDKNILDLNYKIVLIQRAFRNYLSFKTKKKLTLHYINESNREFFAPLKFDRVNILKTEIINKIKSKEMPSKNTDFQVVLNEYYTNYKNFNDEFPDYIKLRNDNLNKYYQCMSLVNYMTTQNNLEGLDKFDEFYINKMGGKKEQTKRNLNSIIGSIEHKMWWYKYRDMDDFEENNIINEVDSQFNFQRINEILAKK